MVLLMTMQGNLHRYPTTDSEAASNNALLRYPIENIPWLHTKYPCPDTTLPIIHP